MTEREQIVAWLREQTREMLRRGDVSGVTNGDQFSVSVIMSNRFADAIERGDHIPPETD